MTVRDVNFQKKNEWYPTLQTPKNLKIYTGELLIEAAYLLLLLRALLARILKVRVDLKLRATPIVDIDIVDIAIVKTRGPELGFEADIVVCEFSHLCIIYTNYLGFFITSETEETAREVMHYP